MRAFEVYTPKQESRLTVFRNMLNRVMDAEATMRNANKASSFGVVNGNGYVTEQYFEMDRKFTSIWEQKAQNMYEMEFQGDPKLEAASFGIRDSLRDQHDQGPVLSAKDCQRIFDIQDELKSLGPRSSQANDG